MHLPVDATHAVDGAHAAHGEQFFATSLSTNQDRASSSMRGEAMVKASTGCAARSILVTIGSRTSPGRSPRTRATAERTSSSASCVGFSSRNSAVMVAPRPAPWCRCA